jgi:hypothetical protein
MPSVVYTVHLWPPLKHARHYTGTAREGRLPQRLTDHALGRGARMLAVQVERGGSWVLGEVRGGGHAVERQLKNWKDPEAHCDVCKAAKAFGKDAVTAFGALRQAGWDHASPVERSMLLEIFGLPEVPAELAAQLPGSTPPAPRPIGLVPQPRAAEITDELSALADALIAQWTASPKAEASAELETQA